MATEGWLGEMKEQEGRGQGRRNKNTITSINIA
jgi:hypothetical protein